MRENSMPLCFGTFYQCGIKPFTGLSQKKIINTLLTDYSHDSGTDTAEIKDYSCTNFAKAKADIKDNLKASLYRLDVDDLVKRLDNIGIVNHRQSAQSLRNFVEICYLSDERRLELYKIYDTKSPLEFIAEVFYISLRANNKYKPPKHDLGLTDTEIEFLNNISEVLDNDDDESNTTTTTRSEHSSTNNHLSYDPRLMNELLQGASEKFSDSFTNTETYSKHTLVVLPDDYKVLLGITIPAAENSRLRALNHKDFLKNMDIDAKTGIIKQGHLEYWYFNGTIDSIKHTLSTLNINDISDFMLFFIGDFQLDRADDIIKMLNEKSNKHTVFMNALLHDMEYGSTELHMIVHICPEKLQKKEKAAQLEAKRKKEAALDDTKIYHINHKASGT